MTTTSTAVRPCNKLWMSQKEAVKYLGVSKDWLEDQREKATLHYSKVGNTLFYIKSEIDNLVANGAIYGQSEFKKEIIKERTSKL